MTFFLVENLHVSSEEYDYTEEMMQEDIENLMTDVGGFYNVEASVDIDPAEGDFVATVDCDHDDFEPEDWDGPVRDQIIESFADSSVKIDTDDFTVLPESDS